MFRALALMLSSGLLVSAAMAQGPARLVDDLTLTPATEPNLDVPLLTSLGNRAYFWGGAGAPGGIGQPVPVDSTGFELWTTDGTVAGTQLVYDALPGKKSSRDYGVTDPVRMGGSVFFGTCDDLLRCHLWKSDGVEGAEVVAELEPDTARSGFHLVAGQDRLYFTFPDRRYGHSLWTSDGTAQGTRLLAGSLADSQSLQAVFPEGLQTGDRLTAFLGDDLWTSDGTPEGTQKVAGIHPAQVVASGALAFLMVPDSPSEAFRQRLWVSDGTASGTRSLLAKTLEVEGLVPVGDGRCFVLSPSLGYSLWITDGTAKGTRLVTQERSRPTAAVMAGGKLYFAGSGGENLALVDPDELTYVHLAHSFRIDRLVPSGDFLYVLRDSHPTGILRWAVGDPLASLQEIENQVTFSPSDAVGVGGGLAIAGLGNLLLVGADGLERPVLPPPSGASTWPQNLTATGHGDNLVFATLVGLRLDGSLDGRLYLVRDGVAELVREGVPSVQDPPSRYAAASFARVADRTLVLYPRLEALDEESGILTPIGPQESPSLRPLGDSAVEFSDRLVFPVRNVPEYAGIWQTDGTEATKLGPVEWSEHTGYAGVTLACQTGVAAGENLFFYLRGDFWSVRDHEIQKLPRFGLCLEAAPHGGDLFFTSATPQQASASVRVQRLYRSDGTSGGTFVLHKDALPYPDRIRDPFNEHLPEWRWSEPTWLGNQLFFIAGEAEHGRELWVSDGTAKGTALFADLRPGYRSSSPRGLTAMDGRLYFAADDGVAGHELWATDGTPEGTVLVADIAPGPESSYPQALAAIDGRLLMAAMGSREQGLELWISDGTERGTYLLQEIQPGPVSSDPSGFTAAGGTVYFEAGTVDEGFELYSMPRDALQAPPPEPACPDETACLVDGRFEVTVEWHNPRNGAGGVGRPIPFSDESVLFWFFSDGNVELIVKVLDGRRINGHYWVFYGGLSDVEYWITVTDSQTGAVREYHNPPGQICGNSDTRAFE